MSEGVPAKRREKAKLATFSWSEDDGFLMHVVTMASGEEIQVALSMGQIAYLAERATAFLAEDLRKRA